MTRADVLYGIAVADAIGNPLEFRTEVGQLDVLASMDSRTLRISDDTQMTMFCAEGLYRSRGRELSVAVWNLLQAYLRWYETQVRRERRAGRGLIGLESLYHREAPGSTCMGSMSSRYAGLSVQNDSKGNGTVMRCYPVAAHALHEGWAHEQAYELAKADARLTHLHPYAAESSVLLIALHLFLAEGETIESAVEMACAETTASKAVSKEVSNMVWGAMDPVQHMHNKKTMRGWVAEEALTLAVGAVLFNSDYLSVITDAITGHSKDSDTIGGIAGGLAAARGWKAPTSLVQKLAALDAVEMAATYL